MAAADWEGVLFRMTPDKSLGNPDKSTHVFAPGYFENLTAADFVSNIPSICNKI
jgi:hypothetical protein